MPFLRVAPYRCFGAASLLLSLVACADESLLERAAPTRPALRSESAAPEPSYVAAEARRCSSRALSPLVLMEFNRGDPTPIGLADGRLLVAGAAVWDIGQRREIAAPRGKLGPFSGRSAVLGGDVALVPGEGDTAELRNIRDGALLQVFDGFQREASGGLTHDGAHVWRWLNDTIKVWTTGGKLLLSTSVEMSPPFDAMVYGNVLRLRRDSNSFQDLDLSDGSLTRGPSFEGSFERWIDAGPDFVTLERPGLVRVYDGTDGHVRATARLDGVWRGGVQRGFLWTYPTSGKGLSEVHVYRLADLTPVLTFPVPWGTNPYPSDGSIAFYAAPKGELLRLDLTGSTPRVDTLRVPAFAALGAYLSSPDGRYVVHGAVSYDAGVWASFTFVGSVATPDALPEPLGCGRLLNTTGSSAGRVAVSTSDGLIRVFDRTSPTPSAPVLTLAYPTDHIELSGDGRTLLARRKSPLDMDQTVRIFSVPNGKVLQTFPHDGADGTKESPLLSRDGRYVGRRRCPAGPPKARCELLVHEVASGRQVFRVGELEPRSVALSPSGTRVAVVSVKPETKSQAIPYFETTVYELASATDASSARSAKVDGAVATFIDDVRFLVVDTIPGSPSPSDPFPITYGGWRIVDSAGNSTSRIWRPGSNGPISSDGVRVHFAGDGAIYDTMTGGVMQSSGDDRSAMVDGLLVDLVNGQLKLTPGVPGSVSTAKWW